MKADTGTLMSLCEKTDNDIRSCINTLQVSGETSLCFLSSSVVCIIIPSHYVFLSVTVPPRSRPQAGGRQDHPVCLRGPEGPEQRLVPSVAGDLPVTTYKTVQNVMLEFVMKL